MVELEGLVPESSKIDGTNIPKNLFFFGGTGD
jgi:hypothetical protein